MNPREEAARTMMMSGIGSLGETNPPFAPSGKEYRSFQTRSGNEPEAMAMERYAFDKARQQGNYPWNIDIDLKSDWSGVGSPYNPPLVRGNVFQSRSGNESDINKMLHLDPGRDINRFYNRRFLNQAVAPGINERLTDKQKQGMMMMIINEALSGGDKFIKRDKSLQSGIFNTDAGHEMLADSYAPQNLLQMYHDALDAGNDDEAERLLFDIQSRYPQLLETRV